MSKDDFAQAVRYRIAEIEADLASVMDLVAERDDHRAWIAKYDYEVWFRQFSAQQHATQEESAQASPGQPEELIGVQSAGASAVIQTKTDRILKSVRAVLESAPAAELPFGVIFKRLPDDVKTIYGKHSTEGIRSVLRRTGARHGIVRTESGAFAIIRPQPNLQQEVAG